MHRIVYGHLHLCFTSYHGGGSYKSIFSYLIDAYSEDTGNTGCLCEEEQEDLAVQKMVSPLHHLPDNGDDFVLCLCSILEKGFLGMKVVDS